MLNAQQYTEITIDMFNAILRHLFPSIKGKVKPNYLYFEKESETAEAIEQTVTANRSKLETLKPLGLLSAEEAHSQAFYDFLFGQSPATIEHDELSRYITEKIEIILRKPNAIIAAMPVLPASLTKVIEQLSNNNFNTEELLALVVQEPAIAVKVVELANSSFYNRSHKEVTDLKSAFMLLGSNGMMEGVINGFVSKLAPHSPIYFKQYGNKIWQHSLTTGVNAKALMKSSSYRVDAAQGYLIALICNLGDMIIYQLLMEAFSFVHPENQPNSYAFKTLMQQKSKLLTYHIAKHWQFPQSIVDALALQVKLTNVTMLASVFVKWPMACFVYEANIISELMLMLEHSHQTEEQIRETALVVLYSEEAKQHIEHLLQVRQ